jgi:hypothetical protein
MEHRAGAYWSRRRRKIILYDVQDLRERLVVI